MKRIFGFDKVYKGYNSFTTSPDSVDEMICKVCGSVCDVERGVIGPTSWAGAMAKCKTPHDSFSCPYNDEEWHSEILGIVMELDNTCSPSLRKIIQKDIDKMVRENL